jgi:small subunit ribosomal protein S17
MAEEPENNEETEEVAAPEEAAPAEEAPTEDAPTADAPNEAAPAEALTPKERRRRAREEKASKRPAPPRTPQERAEVRRRKAVARRTERHRSREKKRANRGEAVPETAAREHQPGVQKVRQGIVVSDKADKTITVRIDITRRHRRYEKIVRTSNTLHAHDETNDAHIGDTVVVRESRPLSRSKRWRLVEVVERAK